MPSPNPDVAKLTCARHRPIRRPLYLANPYSHPEREVMQARLKAVTTVLSHLTKSGEPALAAVAYTSRIQQDDVSPPQGWYHYDLGFLAGCRGLMLLQLPGWERSFGVQLELATANLLELPITERSWENIQHHLEPDTIAVLNCAEARYQATTIPPALLLDATAIQDHATHAMGMNPLSHKQLRQVAQSIRDQAENAGINDRMRQIMELSIAQLQG